MSNKRNGRGEADSINVAGFNVREHSENVEKKGETSKMTLRRKLDVFGINETKLKGKCEVVFGEVVGRVPGAGGRRCCY